MGSEDGATDVHHESIKCRYKSDESGEIGADGEEYKDDGTLICTAEAESVVRPNDGLILQEYGPKVPMCHDHAVYVVEDAPANWDMLSVKDKDRVREVA